jgi:hypothetical protein
MNCVETHSDRFQQNIKQAVFEVFVNKKYDVDPLFHRVIAQGYFIFFVIL